jgi:hypothetical protein
MMTSVRYKTTAFVQIQKSLHMKIEEKWIHSVHVRNTLNKACQNKMKLEQKMKSLTRCNSQLVVCSRFNKVALEPINFRCWQVSLQICVAFVYLNTLPHNNCMCRFCCQSKSRNEWTTRERKTNLWWRCSLFEIENKTKEHSTRFIHLKPVHFEFSCFFHFTSLLEMNWQLIDLLDSTQHNREILKYWTMWGSKESNTHSRNGKEFKRKWNSKLNLNIDTSSHFEIFWIENFRTKRERECNNIITQSNSNMYYLESASDTKFEWQIES